VNVTLIDGAAAVQLDLSDFSDLGEKGFVLIVQNLGTGNVFFDRFDDVTELTGVKIAANGNYEFKLDGASDLWFMADTADADVRYSAVG
jgi:hypothetical protein